MHDDSVRACRAFLQSRLPGVLTLPPSFDVDCSSSSGGSAAGGSELGSGRWALGA